MKTLSSDVCGHEDRVDALVCMCGLTHVLLSSLRSSCRITRHLSLGLRTESLYLLLFEYSLIYCYSCWVVFAFLVSKLFSVVSRMWVLFLCLPCLVNLVSMFMHLLCPDYVSMSQCQVWVFVNVSCIFDSLACSVSVFAFASWSRYVWLLPAELSSGVRCPRYPSVCLSPLSVSSSVTCSMSQVSSFLSV